MVKKLRFSNRNLTYSYKVGMIAPQIHGQAVSSPVTARLGESLTLTISIKGVPPPTVKWFYGTKEIKPCKEFRLKDDGLQYSLHILKVTESLGKKGICISARNRLGEVKRRVDLKVYKVYSSRRHQALSDSETAKSPDSLLFRKKRKLKLIRPRSSPTLMSDSSGPEDEEGHITFISTDSVHDDVVYETIRSSARHVEPPRLKPRKPAIYYDSSLYETYIDYRPSASKKSPGRRSKDVYSDGEIDEEGAAGGAEQLAVDAEMLNPRSWQPDPDYATIEDIRRRRQSPGVERRGLTWRGVILPSRSSELDSRRGHDDDDVSHVTYKSMQYDIPNDDGSSDSRQPASTASENPYGSLHIASETPYGSLGGTSERNYGILKPARSTTQPTQDDHLKTESDNFDGYADISDNGSPYGTATRPIKLSGSLQLERPTVVNGYHDTTHNHQVPPPRASPHEAVNQLWAAQALSTRNYTTQHLGDPSQTSPKTPYQDDYCSYMGRQQGLHPFFADEVENRYSYLPGLDIRNNPHAKNSDYEYSDLGYGTMRSTATDYDSPTRGRNKTRSPQNEYMTYGQARQAMRLNSLNRNHYWSPIGGPYGKSQTGRESGYESGYMSGLANSESHYGIITFPPRDNADGPGPSNLNRSATFPRRSHSQDNYSTRAVPAPVRTINPQQSPPSPHTERFFHRQSFRSPANSPMSSPCTGRQPSRVKQTTEIHTMIKKVSPVRSKSLDRDSPMKRLPDVLSSQSPRVQSVVGTNFTGELFCYVRKASPLSWESMQSDATDLEFGFITEPIVTRLTNGLDVTDNRLTEVTPDPVSAISQPSEGPVISPPLTRRPPIPMSSTIIRSKSAGPGMRYSSLRNRSPSPVRRSTQIRTYDITPTPSPFASTAVTSITTGKPATSSSMKIATSSVSSHLPSPPSYTSITSSTPLRPAPSTRYESETTPKVTSTIETITETEHVFIPMKASSISTSAVTSLLSSPVSSSSGLTSSSKDTKSGTKIVTSTSVDGGKISTRSTQISQGTSSASSASSTSTARQIATMDAGRMYSKSQPGSIKGKGRVLVEEKCLIDKETKFEVHAGNMSEIFQGISDALNATCEGGSLDSTDLGSTSNSQMANRSPQQNLSSLGSIINQFTANSGGIPTLDHTLLESMRSTFGDPEQLIRSLPENLQVLLRAAGCTGQNGQVESTADSATASASDKDSDKGVDESLSKIGSFMLLLIAVILMQIVNHWLSVEGKED